MKFVRTKTLEGIHFVGLLSEPEQKSTKIVVHIHGMAGSPYENGWYQGFHNLYPANGYAFLAGQHRGTGSITTFFQEPDKYPNYGDAFELFEDSVEDIDAWIRYARSLGYTEIYIQSHSFAPSKVVYYVNRKCAYDIKAINLISPVDMLGNTLARSDHPKMLEEAKLLVLEDKGKQLLSELLDGEMYISAQTYLNLFVPESKGNIFCYSDRKHDWSEVNKIQIPTMLMGGTKDLGLESPTTTTKSSFKILKKQLKNSPKVSSVIYEGAQHSFDGYEKEIVKDFVEFLKTI